jgi:hypothetical protein
VRQAIELKRGDGQGKKMKPYCHAMALAAVGWYLMVPPSPDPRSWNAPLSEWTQFVAFDRADACEHLILMARDDAEKAGCSLDNPQPPKVGEARSCWGMPADLLPAPLNTRVLRVALGRCVATDDPRLVPSWW